MEFNGLYAIIHCWWLLLGATFETNVHELVNWLIIQAFLCHAMGGLMVHVSILITNFLSLFLFSINLKFLFHFGLNL